MGELAALVAAAVWAGASILWARLGREATARALNFLKCSFAAMALAFTLWVLDGRAGPGEVDSMDMLWLSLSGLVGLTLGDTAYIHALQRIGARRSLLMWALAPGLSALLAWPILGEPIHGAMLLGMTLTLGGVVWVVLERSDDNPNDGPVATPTDTGLSRVEKVGLLFAGLAVLGQASSNVLVKMGGVEVGALGASVVRLSVAAVGLGIYLGALGRLGEALLPLRTPATGATVVVATLLGTYLGIWLSAYGVLHAEVGVATSLNSTSPLFVLPLAVWLEGERLSPRAILGACVAVAGVAVFFLS